MVIGGSGFSGADEVLFGVTPAAFQFWSDGVVTATAPPGVGIVQVAVRTKLGVSPQPVRRASSPMRRSQRWRN